MEFRAIWQAVLRSVDHIGRLLTALGISGAVVTGGVFLVRSFTFWGAVLLVVGVLGMAAAVVGLVALWWRRRNKQRTHGTLTVTKAGNQPRHGEASESDREWPRDPAKTYGGRDASTITAGPHSWVVQGRLEDVGNGWRALRCVAADALGRERFTDEMPPPARPGVPVVLEPHVFPESDPLSDGLTLRWEHAPTRGYAVELIDERTLAIPPLLASPHEHVPTVIEQINTLRADSARRRGIRDALGEFLEQGGVMLWTIENAKPPDEWQTPVQEWADRLDAFLEQELGDSFRAQMNRPAPPSAVTFGGATDKQTKFWQAVHVRIERLNKLMDDFK